MTDHYQMAAPPPPPIAAAGQREYNKTSVIAVVCAGAGTFLFFPLVLVGFALGLVGIVQCRQRRERGLCLAVTAVVVSTLAGAFTVAMILLFALNGHP